MGNPLKVLLPTNFSVQASYAQILLEQLAKSISIECHLAHVLPFPETVSILPDGNILTCGEIDPGFIAMQRDLALKKLKEVDGNFAGYHILVGSFVDALVKYADAQKFDLIVMGTKGTDGWVEKLTGSKAQHVVRQASVPVLSLMCDRSEWQPKEVLLVHQFDKEDIELPQAALEILKVFGSEVHLLEFVKEENAEKQNKIYAAMDQFAGKLGLSNIKKHVLVEKDVEQGVYHFDQMKSVDLLLIGTHAKGGIFHQSATEKLVNHMYKPILTFHI
jgi:nucleotide-binding universal stress UspA family protein